MPDVRAADRSPPLSPTHWSGIIDSLSTDLKAYAAPFWMLALGGASVLVSGSVLGCCFLSIGGQQLCAPSAVPNLPAALPHHLPASSSCSIYEFRQLPMLKSIAPHDACCACWGMP